MTIKTKVEINGIDVTSKLIKKAYTIERTFGDMISTATIELANSVDSLLTITEGQKVEIWRGFTTATDDKIFRGFIEAKEKRSHYTIKCKDRLAELIKAEVTKSFDKDIDTEAGVISEIAKTLITTHGNLNADATTVQSTGSVLTLQKYVCNHDDVFSKVKRLADIVDYQLYYRPDTNKVYFEPKGFVNNSTVLTVDTGGNVIKTPKWKDNISDLANCITVVGAKQFVEHDSQSFSGDNSTKNFTLANTPIDTKVLLGGVFQDPGKTGSTSTFDYEVDEERKLIKFVTAPPVGVNNVVVDYTFGIPGIVQGEDAVSITTYGGEDSKPHQKTFFEPEIKTVDDAEKRLDALLTKYSTPFISTKLLAKINSTTGLAAGQLIRVDDNVNNRDENVVIKKLIIRAFRDYDEIEVGDKEFRLADWGADIAEKVKRLSEENIRDTDLLRLIRTFEMDIPLEIHSIDVETQAINNSFILSHTVNGRLGVVGGTQPVLGDQRSAPVTVHSEVF